MRGSATIPGQPVRLGTLQQAQAFGDYRALVDKGRRVVRIHLHADVESGIRDLTDAMQSALPRGRDICHEDRNVMRGGGHERRDRDG
jgi:hypothetical protein